MSMTHIHHIKSLALLSFLLAVITVGPVLADAASPSREKIRACQYEARDRRWDALNEVRSDYYAERSELRTERWNALGEISDWKWDDAKEDDYDAMKDLIMAYYRSEENTLRSAYREATSEIRSIYSKERRLCRKHGYIPVNYWDKFKGLEFEVGPALDIRVSPENPDYPHAPNANVTPRTAEVNPHSTVHPDPTPGSYSPAVPANVSGVTPAQPAGATYTPLGNE